MTPRPRTLLHIFPSFQPGGVQLRFAQLANHFGPRYRHLVIALDGAIGAKQRLGPHVDVTFLHNPTDQKGLRSSRAVLGRLRPDLLVTSNWGSMTWSMANCVARVPHLHMEDGFGLEEAEGQLRRRVWARRLALRRATITVPSRTLLHIASNVWRLPRHAVVHIPNGVNCARFLTDTDPQIAARYGIRKDVPIIGTVSALRSEKNLLRLLDAFSLVLSSRPAQLIIVGDGPQRQRLEHAAQTRGLSDHTVFAGNSPSPEQLLPFLSVFSLSSDTEQMPLTVLEAMAASRPIAATDVGDIREMVASKNQPFIVSRDARALSKAILDLLTDPERMREIGRSNRERAASMYDENIMFDAYQRLFDGITTTMGPG